MSSGHHASRHVASRHAAAGRIAAETAGANGIAPDGIAPDRIAPDWIAVDWGTSNLRVWAMAANGSVLASAGSDAGMGTLARGDFAPALLELVGGWLGGGLGGGQDRLHDASACRALVCGMAGARQGWVETAYRAVPCAPLDAAGATPAPTGDPRLDARILPGLSQASPADVMRGEETQIAGYLAGNPGFDGVLCLPGTHTKWVHISAGEVVSFRTFMTGEMFALLSRQSVLRHGMPDMSVEPAGEVEAWDGAAFAEAVTDAIARPEAMAARMFGLRAEGLLTGLAPGTARARLSGLLIGAELAAARPYWLGQAVTVIGTGSGARPYIAALTAQGAAPAAVPVDTMTLAGLTAAYLQLAELAA